MIGKNLACIVSTIDCVVFCMYYYDMIGTSCNPLYCSTLTGIAGQDKEPVRCDACKGADKEHADKRWEQSKQIIPSLATAAFSLSDQQARGGERTPLYSFYTLSL